MATGVVMPKLGMSMTEGTVVVWHINEGQRVHTGEIIAEVETEKIVYEIESPEDGIMLKILVPTQQSCEVGKPIALIGAEGEQPVVPVVEASTPGEASGTPSSDRELGLAEACDKVKDVCASPSARRIARELGVDLTTIVGTGPGGRIVKQDVLQVAGTQEIETEDEDKVASKVVPLTATRRTIASRMQASAQTVPHVTLQVTADARALVRARAAHRDAVAAAGVKLSYANWTNDLLIFVLSRALAKDGTLNASFEDGTIRYYEHVHVSLAVASDEGLVVPVIRHADRLGLIEIAQQRSELMAKARARKLSRGDVEGGTFTLTNLGMYPVDNFGAIINPPQAAILSVGRIRQEPALENGSLFARDVIGLGLTFDHRVADGASAGKFLAILIKKLENLVVDSQRV